MLLLAAVHVNSSLIQSFDLRFVLLFTAVIRSRGTYIANINFNELLCMELQIYFYENLLSLKIRPFNEIFILRKFGAIR